MEIRGKDPRATELAILLVIGYHAFSRWPALIADDCCARFPLFALGSLGVELFFLVSGFVILMTLERCGSALEFLRKRWLRLFPAMLICSLLIYFTAPLLHERPAGAPTLRACCPAGWSWILAGRASSSGTRSSRWKARSGRFTSR